MNFFHHNIQAREVTLSLLLSPENDATFEIATRLSSGEAHGSEFTSTSFAIQGEDSECNYNFFSLSPDERAELRNLVSNKEN